MTRGPRYSSQAIGRLSQRLLIALREHEPEFGEALDTWSKQWDAFQGEKRRLFRRARNLLQKKGLPDDIVANLSQRVVSEALDIACHGADPMLSGIEDKQQDRATFFRYSPPREKPARTASVRRPERGRVDVCKGTKPDMERASEAYDEVLDQMTPESITGPSVDTYHRIGQQARRLEELVDELVLKGKPRGHCSLCPT